MPPKKNLKLYNYSTRQENYAILFYMSNDFGVKFSNEWRPPRQKTENSKIIQWVIAILLVQHILTF